MEGAELQWSGTGAQTGEGVKPSDPDLGVRGDSHTETGEDEQGLVRQRSGDFQIEGMRFKDLGTEGKC